MKYSIRTKGNTHTLEVVEDETVCTLTLGKTHDIVTKGDDPTGLALEISSSYRNSFGKGAVGKEFLKLIKSDLIKNTGIIPENKD